MIEHCREERQKNVNEFGTLLAQLKESFAQLGG